MGPMPTFSVKSLLHLEQCDCIDGDVMSYEMDVALDPIASSRMAAPEGDRN